MILAKETPRRGKVVGGEMGVQAVSGSRGRGCKEMTRVMRAIGRECERPGRGHRSEGE